MSKELTVSTDVWALGACLFVMAFYENCFPPEQSSLAIIGAKYTMPPNDQYGPDSAKFRTLIRRMLEVDVHARLDINEVIAHLSAIYSGAELPALTRSPAAITDSNRVGTYNVSAQGMGARDTGLVKTTEVKKLSSNSAAARRKAERHGGTGGAFTPPAPAPASAAAPAVVAPVAFDSGFDENFGVGVGANNDGFGGFSSSSSASDPFGVPAAAQPSDDLFGSSDFGAPPAPPAPPAATFNDPFGAAVPAPASASASASASDDLFGNADSFGAQPTLAQQQPPPSSSSANNDFGSMGGISFGNTNTLTNINNSDPFGAQPADPFSAPTATATSPQTQLDPFSAPSPPPPAMMQPPPPSKSIMNANPFSSPQTQMQQMGGNGMMGVGAAFSNLGMTPQQRLNTPPNSNANYEEHVKNQQLFNSVGGGF